jgi:hypothetical protein
MRVRSSDNVSYPLGIRDGTVSRPRDVASVKRRAFYRVIWRLGSSNGIGDWPGAVMGRTRRVGPSNAWPNFFPTLMKDTQTSRTVGFEAPFTTGTAGSGSAQSGPGNRVAVAGRRAVFAAEGGDPTRSLFGARHMNAKARRPSALGTALLKVELLSRFPWRASGFSQVC